MADEEVKDEVIVIDYDEIDETTGFRKAEYQIWQLYEAYLSKPEDDRPDLDAWIDEICEEKKFDKKRVKCVTTLGIYAGPRDEFHNRSGSGKAIYANGDVYEGDFFEGKKNGTGHYTFARMKRGEVQIALQKLSENNQLDTYSAPANLQIGEQIVLAAQEYGFFPCYHGEYIAGKRNGEGVMINADGSVYKGEWKNNKRHGKGIMYFLNGDVYSGNWSEGLKHGFGSYTFAKNNGEYRGEWNNGNYVDGQWIMSNGVVYEGLFDKKNRPCDTQATMHFPFPDSQISVVMNGVYKKGKWAPTCNLNVVRDGQQPGQTWSA